MPDSDSLNLIPSTQLTNPPILTPSVMAITTFPGHHNPSHNVCFHYGTSCDLCLDHGALTTAPLCLPAAAPSVASPRPALPVFSSSSHGLYKIKLDFQPPTMLKPGSLTPTPTRPRYVDRRLTFGGYGPASGLQIGRGKDTFFTTQLFDPLCLFPGLCSTSLPAPPTLRGCLQQPYSSAPFENTSDIASGRR